MTTLTLELPEELVALLGSPEAAVAQAKEALVLELLRQTRISQGKAATLLGLTRWEIIDLMAKHDILMGPLTAEELDREVAALHAHLTDQGEDDDERSWRSAPDVEGGRVLLWQPE